MKVLAGELKGHPFGQPKTRSVRPLSDKVRAAIFDVLGSVDGQTVLDAYAGSGAAGFEAASRGAVLVDAIEANSRVFATIQENARQLGLDWGYMPHLMTVETWLASPTQQERKARYDLIIADPPYAKLEPDVLEHLAEFLVSEGILAVSYSSRTPSPVLKSAQLVQAKVYGDTGLSFYRANS